MLTPVQHDAGEGGRGIGRLAKCPAPGYIGRVPGPQLFSIPFHRAFADALAGGLLHRFGRDPLALARGLILLPNNRAIRAVTDAFVRRAEAGLLLPRLVSIGDPALDDAIGAALDPLGESAVPPAIAPLDRQLILARLIEEARAGIEPTEAVRLAADLGRVLDQLIVEEVAPARLAEAVPAELAGHWQASLDLLQIVLGRWPEELKRRGRIDLADRRNRLIEATTRRWAAIPPPGFVCAAGIGLAGPAVGRLLHRVARLPEGMVVFAGLDRALPQKEWDALDPGEDGRALETHPQFALHQLLDRIGAGREEVRNWPRGGVGATSPERSRAIGHAMTAAAFTDRWEALSPRAKRLSGVTAAVLPNPAAEAQAIALALREAVETPGRTAALVTPDRALAARVAAHLARWGIAADDSAGRPLSLTPPGTLLLALAEALAQDFAPVALLALLKHPLVRAGEGRIAWLEGVRRLDKALRGPRPAAGLDAIARHLASDDPREARDRSPARGWWAEARALLDPWAALASVRGLARLAAGLREAADALAGDEAWRLPAGRAAAELIAALEANGAEGPRAVDVRAFPTLLRALLDQQAIRPPQGGHPRVSIWGLIEARLQQADLVVLGGLNEGVWPAAPAPDPWLAPAVRRTLGLPGLERRIGIEAHEFAGGLGSPQVLLTRARRDARAPAVASRFWLRLEAMTGGIVRHPRLARWADMLDRPDDFAPAERPAPSPPVAERPTRIAVTKLDRLMADPFAFYADQMLRLRPWDAVDADPSAAWRGSAVHKLFELWITEDACDPAALRPRAERMLADTAAHPVIATLWTPRLLEAIDRLVGFVAEDRAEGRSPLAAEVKGSVEFGAIALEGIADRVDRLADGRLAIVDYKTGQPPSRRAVEQGYAMQLGLLGLIAERGGFGEALKGETGAWEYWSLAAKKGELGHRDTPAKRDKQGRGVAPEDFVAHAARVLEDAVATWLTGDAPFTAKLHPEYAPYADYDQLMRLDEWYGRGKAS